MMVNSYQPYYTVKQVLQLAGRECNTNLNSHSQRVLQRIKACRSATLGYHLYRCADRACGALRYQYHSCRDRHCPMCGQIRKEEWIEARSKELLPVAYFHAVFTLPAELNQLMMANRRLLYKLLFDASAATLLSFAKDPQWMGATPGIVSVLHTWGQQLSFHPHVHCIVSGGGIDSRQKWKEGKRCKEGFLFPTKAMAVMFRAKYLEGVRQLWKDQKLQVAPGVRIDLLLKPLWKKTWVVYAKPPWGGPAAVIEYLGRYTHKAAISNYRIKDINEAEGMVSFVYKDYSDSSKRKLMTLSIAEFARRFAQHILPKGFTRIRSYGYLANRGRQQRVNQVLQQLDLPPHPAAVNTPVALRLKEKYGLDMYQCPCCKTGRLELMAVHYFSMRSDDG